MKSYNMLRKQLHIKMDPRLQKEIERIQKETLERQEEAEKEKLRQEQEPKKRLKKKKIKKEIIRESTIVKIEEGKFLIQL